MATGFGVRHEWDRLREAIVFDDEVLDDGELCRTLEREGVIVRRQPAIAPRDPLIVIGPHLIEASLRGPERQAERFALRPLVQQVAQRRGVQWTSVPPGWANAVDGPWLEGGDVVLNGSEIYVGMSGRASDMAGIDWLERLLGPDYRVIPMAMRSSVKHLEDVLALVRPGLLVCCPALLIDGLPTALRAWDAIVLSPGEAEAHAAHFLGLDERRAIIEASNGRVDEELRRRDITTLPLVSPRGLRTAYHPLWRERVAV